MNSGPERRSSSNGSGVRSTGQNERLGMTLLEMTVVILVLLSLITILFIGAKAWKRGSDRSLCIVNIHQVQQAVRGYANLNGFAEGSVAPNLRTQIIGLGRFIETTPVCPGNGSYSFGEERGAEIIPLPGELYMGCSLGTSLEHVPSSHDDW